MRYRPPPVPPEATASSEAEAAYLLENGFTDTAPGGLAEKIREKGRLRVKLGLDPTAPAVTWGWSVVLRRLRRAQELGHTAVLIIGDYTAQVGDPSGRSSTRRRLSAAEVEQHVEACRAAMLGVLSEERLEVRGNSEWLSKMAMEDVLRLSAQTTVAQMLAREDFATRFRDREPISLLEFLYPLLQAQDSVEVQADVELGGTDQLFNLLLGRHLQERAGQEPQVALTSPLLVGTDGKKKMSQSEGNYIAVDWEPAEIFGKAMSLPDEAMAQYLSLALDWRDHEVAAVREKNLEPVQLKRLIAREMVSMFHGSDAAGEAEATFDRVFVHHDVPEDMAEHRTSERYMPRILVELGWVPSLSEARRQIGQGGVRVDGAPLDDPHAELGDGSYVLQSGRRKFARVTIG